MGKVRQRNWLITITVFLVIISGAGLLLSMKQKLSFSTCAYGENIYKSGDDVPDYNGDQECYCNSNGAIKCDQTESDLSYTDYSSKNLTFTYDYLNLLNDTISSSIVASDSISFSNNTLTVVLERDSMCSANGDIPVQTGLYNLSNTRLVLTVMTSQGSQYNTACRVTDTFRIANANMTFSGIFKVYFQLDDGSLIDLNACVYQNDLHADQEVFKPDNAQSVCLCDAGTVTCKDL